MGNKHLVKYPSHYGMWDMSAIGAGAAFLAASAGLLAIPVSKDQPKVDGARLAIAVVCGLVGLAILWKNSWRRVPAAEIERSWNERFNVLCDDMDWFIGALTASYGGYRDQHSDARDKWTDYLPYLPRPHVEVGPLSVWVPDIEAHSADARHFLHFLKLHVNDLNFNKCRRSAIGVYDDFGLLLQVPPRGFKNWMEKKNVEGGGAELLLILAYFEIAKAASVTIGKPRDPDPGFWYLMRTWHSQRPLLRRVQ